MKINLNKNQIKILENILERRNNTLSYKILFEKEEEIKNKCWKEIKENEKTLLEIYKLTKK